MGRMLAVDPSLDALADLLLIATRSTVRMSSTLTSEVIAEASAAAARVLDQASTPELTEEARGRRSQWNRYGPGIGDSRTGRRAENEDQIAAPVATRPGGARSWPADDPLRERLPHAPPLSARRIFHLGHAVESP